MFIRRIAIPKNANMHPQIYASILTCGGIGLMTWSGQCQFEEYLAALPQVCRDVGITRDDQFVTVMQELIDYLSADQLEALLLHEEGHYHCGHLDQNAAGLVVNQDYEYAADAYAADRVGAAVVITALQALPQFVLTVTLPQLWGDLLTDELCQAVAISCDDQLSSRIERLRARL